jgi:hypothetical protein
MGRTCSKHGREEECVKGRPEGKRPLGRPKYREDNNKFELREIGLGSMD